MESYSKFVFTDESKRKEWEDLDADVKKSIISTLNKTCDEMEAKYSIQLLCNLYIDLQERIENLEKGSN